MTRIGTWNLAGRWSDAHRRFLVGLDCDVLLLTEVRRDVTLPGFHGHLSGSDMAPRRAWAGVLSRQPLVPCADPHAASAMVVVNGLAHCSSILPWRSAGARTYWPGDRHADRTAHTISALRRSLPARVVWGGDFNHALDGREWSGSKTGRGHIHGLLNELGLGAPTTALPHRIDGLFSIDHVAVPCSWTVRSASAHRAVGLSDHDAYTVDV